MFPGVCRVCLADDVRLLSMDVQLLDVYEKLTSAKVRREDRGNKLCYICYSQLQKCCRFTDQACRSEIYLRLLESDLKINKKVNKQNLPKIQILSVINLKPISYVGFNKGRKLNPKITQFRENSNKGKSINNETPNYKIDTTTNEESGKNIITKGVIKYGSPKRKYIQNETNSEQGSVQNQLTTEISPENETKESFRSVITMEGIIEYETPTKTETPTPTKTETPTKNETPTPTKTETPTKNETPTPTKTETPTKNESPTPTKTETPTPTKNESPTPTKTKIPTPTKTETSTKNETPTPTKTKIPTTITETPTPTKTETPTPTKTETPTPTKTKTPTPNKTETPTPTKKPAKTQTPTKNETPTPAKRVKNDKTETTDISHKELIYFESDDEVSQITEVKDYVVINNTELFYECDTCHNIFKTRDDLAKHQLTHKREIKPKYKMEEINEKRPNIKVPYCPICKKFFAGYESQLQEHLRIHTGERPFVCDLCGKTSRTKHHLLEHIRTHTKEKVYCQVCKKGFTQLSSLGKHKLIHTQLSPYCCHICGKSFKQNGQMKAHIRFTHEGVRPYGCDVCAKRLTSKSELTRHAATHVGLKAYSCDRCGTKFTTNAGVTRHKKNNCKIDRYVDR